MSNIREVAALAGVSAATVSRVINHDTHYKMTDETKEKVWKAVAELDYKAPASGLESAHINNTAASNITKSTYKFGCILNVRGGKYNDPYYLSILSGFEQAIHAAGHDISFIKSSEELSDAESLYNTFSTRVDGLILMNVLEDNAYEYIKKQTPFIVGVDTNRSDIDNIAYDHENSARIAVTHLANKGYKRIGFIGGRKEDLKLSRRFQGYYSTLYALGLPFSEDWLIASNWDDTTCVTAINKAISEDHLPDAYFASSDFMAMAALRALFQNGKSVPDDIAVIGLTNIEMSKFSNPPLSTINIPSFEMGEVAAATLLSRLAGDTSPAKKITMATNLVERSST